MKILSADCVLPIAAPPIVGGAVAFEGGTITAVGTKADLVSRYPEAAAEDFGGSAIMPGLVNVHSHLELTALRGFADEHDHDFSNWLLKITAARSERLDESDVRLSALAGAVEGAIAGVTCFGDIGRLGVAGLEALRAVGLRGVVFQESEFCPDDRTAEDDFAKLAEKFTSLREHETDRVLVGLSPHAPYTVSAKMFDKIARYAIENNVRVSVHASESVMEEELMRYGTGFFAGVFKKFGIQFKSPGTSTIEFLDRLGVLAAKPLLAHCVRVSDRDIELIAESDSRVAHCPKSNAKFGHGTAPFDRFLARGIKVGFGSDSMASNNSCDLFEEARFAALLARNSGSGGPFVQPQRLIETATLGGARALGLESEIGSLEPGKQADLIVVGLGRVAQQPVHDVHSTLVFATGARDVRLTVVGGDEIARDGATLSVDAGEIGSRFGALRQK